MNVLRALHGRKMRVMWAQNVWQKCDMCGQKCGVNSMDVAHVDINVVHVGVNVKCAA